MNSRPLRHILSLQFIAAALLPFMLIAVLGFFWFFPQATVEIENRERQFVSIINSQVESYLLAAFAELKAVSSYPIGQETGSHELLQSLLDSHFNASITFRSIYVVGPSGHIMAVGFPPRASERISELLRQDIIGLDFTQNILVKEVGESHEHAWSDTFLSIVGGGLSVALALPSGNGVVIGELDLDKLTEYLKRSVLGAEQRFVFVLDRHGQVIADQDGRYTAQQLNLNNIHMVSKGLHSSSESFGRFEFNGLSMIGHITKNPLIAWYVLVAQPYENAYGSLRKTAGIIAVGLFTALLLGIFFALHLSRKLALRFNILEAHARRVADGQNPGEWPQGPISEFNHLGYDLQQMAQSISQRESELLETTQRLQLATASEHLGIWDWNVQSDVLIWDARMFELYGVTPGTATRCVDAWKNGLHPDDRAEVIAAVEAAIRGEQQYDIEYRIVQPNGSVKDLKAVGMVIRDHGGQAVRMIGLNRDITEQRLAEARMRLSQKMEAIGTLAGGIAHDFNNILSVIMGYTELALEEKNPEERTQNLEQVRIGAERARELVQQILTFSHGAEINKQPLQVSMIIKETMKMLRASIPKTIEIKQDIISNAFVVADPTQIHQVIMNLCTNAYHAMRETGGTLCVSLREFEIREDDDGFGELVSGRYLELEVSDTGAGICPEIQDKIFEPYFTTKKTGEGTGLGLAVVHGIVKSYSGHIIVNSEQGRGTTFQVYLPVIAEKPVAFPDKEVITDLVGKGERIMFVDDEEGIRSFSERLLTAKGYQVTSCHDGVDALEKFQRQPDQFEIVITDMTMPYMTGAELAQRILGIRPDIPIILCTGQSELINREKALALGFCAYLDKPVTRHDFLSAIREALGNNTPQSLP